MIKYCFNVYDCETKDKITSVICDCDHMLETIKVLNELGIVKGYILDEEVKK